MLKDWWYADRGNTIEGKEDKKIDFSGFTQALDAPEWIGVTVQYEAVEVLAGDWFTVVLPEPFADVQMEESFVSPEGVALALTALEEPEHGTKLTVCFSTAGVAAGDLPLQFRLPALESVSLRLQEGNEFTVIPPQVQQDTPQTNAAESESEPEEQYSAVFLDDPEPEPTTFSIKGDIQFDETVDGFDWRSILRPLEFDQNIKIVATYRDNNNEDQTVDYWAQDDLPLDAFYWMLTHDGEGGGSFEIANVPDHVTLEDGKVVAVTKYTVSIDTSLPYYQSSSFEVTDMGATQTLYTLKLTVKTQTLTLAPTVVGDPAPQAFPMQLTFTKPNPEAVAQPSITKTVNPTNTKPFAIRVPAGIQFQVVQEAVPGYKWDGSYTVTAKTGEQESVSSTSKSATGTIEEDTDVTVSTKNYMQNLTYPFTVKWVDNDNASRPTLGADNFPLQYKTENGEWTSLTEDSLATLGIDQLPTFDASQAALRQYTYRGLPSNDTAGNVLSYRVVANGVTGYTVSPNETYKEFTYRKTTSFNAAIYWLDSSNADNQRPSTLPLKLYRRAANGSYEVVAAEPVVTQNGNTWTVSVPDLPCFNDQDQEYDYVIVQGSIGEENVVTQTPIENYKTSYDNDTGNYGKDIALCHNGGTMTQRISADVTFTATKVWKDPLTEPAQRPKVIVTLWRYSVPDDGDPGIDAMYNQNLAAQVIYRKTTETGYQDVLLSYHLKNEDNEEAITFTSATVENLPSDFTLPAYDEQGRKYVYFVRETVDSDNYETSYAYQGKTLAQGAPNGGTVTNTRREKALINITKVWQCPSNLPDIEGTSIQLTLQMPVEKDGTTEYKDLTVYSSDLGSFDKLTGDALTAAQTLSGFTENIATLDLQFFVNIYDENGHPYDMTKAIVKEIKVLKENGETTDEITLTEQGTFELNGNQFIAASEYKGNTLLADGMQEFRYKETNTITGTRKYQLIKVWQGFDETEYASVSFTLTRRSSKYGAQYETVQPPEGQDAWLVKKEEDWQRVLENLPKYDHQGYEYLYSATEVAVIDTDGKPVEANWSSYHFRTEDLTKVTNYRGTGGSGAIYFSKQWMDNGDTEARKPVTVRVYRKADVAAALEKYSEDAVVSLSDLSIGYADYTLSTDNSWFAEAALSDVENQIHTTANSSASKGELGYLILEYKVGSEGAVAAKYPVSQLMAAANGTESTITGTVSNSTRQYEVSVQWQNDGKQAYITNTRIGQASLEVTKDWNDDNNASHLRPASVKFQVYQDGLVYTPGTGAASITCEGAEWDPTNGIITVSNTDDTNKASSWSFRLENLPLFSDAGVPHTYNLEEIGDGELTVGGESQTGTSSYYLSTKGKTIIRTSSGTPDLVTYAFTFDNTLTGTTMHTVHKTWQDRDSGGCDRPDLYLTLYRYLKSEAEDSPDTPVEKLPSYQPYIDCKDPVWTVDDAYHWRAEVTNLPLYDNQGRKYVYRFQEKLNNGGVTVYGTYAQKAEYGVEANCGVCEAYGILYDRPYDKFTNTLTGEMTISGVKTWTGFGGYEVEPKDYPAVTIELYRSLDPTIDPLNRKDEVVQRWIAEGRIEKMGKQVEMRYDPETDTYPTTYSFGTAGEGLPKFNEEGRRWYYSIREVFPSEIADSLYTEKFENGTLTNVFRKEVNRRAIAVTKTWAGRENLKDGEKKYPSVTFQLYRYVKQDTPELLKTVKINANQFAENGTYTYTFDDLLIYSPSGEEYRYYITEKAIDGYTISYTDEDGIADGYSDNGRSDVISIPHDPFDEEDHVVNVGTTNTYDQPDKITITGKKYWDDYGNSPLIYGARPETIEITLKRYTQSESGQNNAVSSETIELANVENPNQPYIQWEKSVDGNSNYWKYTIHNLERYAPNGMPYIYSLTETPVDGYQLSNGTVSGTAGNQGNLTLGDLTNSLGATYYVRKNWMDGNNKYGLRPTSITVVLQRSNDGTDWQNILWEGSFGTYNETTKKWTGLPSVTTDGAGKPIVSIKLTADYVMNNTKGNSWQYTFTNLPVQDEAGNTWKYRCIETHIENAAVEPVAGKDNTYTAGAYTCTYPIQDDAKTVIQNKLESTSLHVTKIWEGDQNDLYHSQPDSLTFVLQMRGIKQVDGSNTEEGSTGGSETGGTTSEEGSTSGEGGGSEGEFELSDWMNVQKDGSDYTFTITKAQNWQKTLQDLPVAMVGEDGRTYYTLYFRAVEIHADDSVDTNGNKVLGKKPVGAQNYEDRTDYALKSDDHFYNPTLTRNESKITNQLIVKEAGYSSITANKVWHHQDGKTATATFELLYKTKDETIWHCYDGRTLSDPGNLSHSVSDKCLTKTLESTAENQSVTWTQLPQCDRDGNELVYKVVEHPVAGYKTEVASKDTNKTQNTSLFTAFVSLFTSGNTTVTYDTEYTFTNIELQSYTVKKAWQNTDYAEKTDGGFTATFQLQQQVAGSDNWTDVAGAVQTLTATNANAPQSHTWGDLPKYTTDGKQITYRAVETKINGKAVADNTNGAYIVTYQYDNVDSPAFAGTETIATNRMVYGFVNLSKAAAYLASSVTADGDKKLAGVVFNIYSGTDTSKTPYVSNVVTDANGNLTRNDDGTYGGEHKYLISGTYTLKEISTNQGYSVWRNGVTFTVGVSGNGNTGEHGTAWISTSGIGKLVLSLKAEYKASGKTSHTFVNTELCEPVKNGDNAYNLESRGVIQFTKTGTNGVPLDTHAGASGESKAYFGVYTDAACNNQVAGMMAEDSNRTTIVLTTLAQDGTENATAFLAKKNEDDIPYLRKDNGMLTLLSGTYYLKELVAPPGYKLDTTVRTATVPALPSTDNDSQDLSNVYSSNVATIDGLKTYNWPNAENQVTLYKRDQYGRIVDLGANGYLELSVYTGTFLTGENTIRLYQNVSKPATKADGQTLVPSISYDSVTGSWTIKGLFDIGKTYTLSEPKSSVPENNIQAKAFAFTMGADGSITVTTGAESKGNPLEVVGNDYENYYKSDAANNEVVLRDVARFLTDVGLEKIDAETNASIANISFELYKVGTDTAGNAVYTPVLETGKFLTTDADGKIKLSETSGYQNLITGCDLKYGLDVGKYYFQEIEHGASDSYRLLDKIFFEIIPNQPTGESPNYQDYAKVVFDTPAEGPVSQIEGDRFATVKNTPVTEISKTLDLTKVDSENGETKLSGAQFTLTYTSINEGTTGSHVTTTYYCVTGSDGVLYLRQGNTPDGQISSEKPDISKKGSYVLVETQAPDDYMTRTEDGTTNRVTMVTFDVNSENQITNVQCYNGKGELVSYGIAVETSGEHTALNLTVKNEKTVVSIAKRNDIESNTKTSDQKRLNGEPLSGAVLEIYEGVGATEIPLVTLSGSSEYTLEPGKLKENTICTLHEKEAPVGYLAANDIYFKLFGTTTKDGKTVSQLYVWTGSGTPTVDGTDWSKTSSIKDAVLTMVDEAIIAPVDLQKVVGDAVSGYQALPGAVFEVKSLDGEGIVLGTAVTNDSGHLVWQTVTNPSGLVFNSSGKRITSDEDKATVIGKTIILRQNTSGYQFKETYAPDNAYNDGRSFTVKITDQNYVDYRDGGYQTDVYVDILAAGKVQDNTVSTLTTRDHIADENDVVNLPYKSTVTLRKYDADEEANKAAIPGTEFTLYHATVSEGTWTKGPVVTDAYVTGATSPQGSGIFTTDESGNLSIGIHNKGAYILVETKAATGYYLDANNPPSFPFELIDDKSQPYGYGQTTSLATSGATSGVPNERSKGTVTLMKKDSGTNAALNDVVYTLTRTDTDIQNGYLLKDPKDVSTGKTYTAYQDDQGKWQWTEENGTAGELKIVGLNWGSYRLVEKTERSGYVKSGTVYDFTVAKNALTHEIGTGTPAVVTNSKNHVTFRKTDTPDTGKNAKPLAGAVFEVHEGDSCSSACQKAQFYVSNKATIPVTTVTSGNDGTVTIYGLPTDNASDTPKTYHLVETTAPKGYKIAEPVIFTMDRYGNVKVQKADVTEVVMQDKPIELYIEKVGEDLGTKLSGAVFTLTDVCTGACDHLLANSKSSETGITTGEGGKVMIPIERVIAGHTYMLEETKAPDGYECTAKVTFTVKPNGTAELVSTEGGHTVAVLDETNQTTFTISNERIGLSLTKVDYDTPAHTLAGVKFTLKPADGSSFIDSFAVTAGDTIVVTRDSDNHITLVTLTTGTDGKITIPVELVKHDNSYILTEQDLSGAYPNYRYSGEANHQITFKVEKDGTFTITSPNAMFQLAVGDATALVVSNQQIMLTVQKLDQGTGQPLPGVKLKLSKDGTAIAPKDIKLDADGTWTTDASGTVVFKGPDFTPGTYKLEELQAPEGYNTIAGVLTFTIDPAGKISQTAVGDGTLTGLTGESWKAQNFSITNPKDGQPGGITLEVANAKYADLQITKQGSDGAQLAGVEFKLEYPDGPVTAATDDNGIATFSGLPDGKYRLTERKTAQGYNLLSAPLEIRIDRNSETYTVSYNGGTASGGSEGTLTRQGDTLLLTVINQKGLALPATGVTTPQLPKAVLGLTALLEALALYAYQRGGKRWKRRHDG